VDLLILEYLDKDWKVTGRNVGDVNEY